MANPYEATARTRSSSVRGRILIPAPTAPAQAIKDYSIVLNRTSPDWSVAFYVNNALVPGSPFTYSTNPTIHDVAFGGILLGNVDNFTLSQTVPEPSSVALLGLAALGLFAAARATAYQN